MKTQVCVSDALLIYTITRVLEPRHNDSTSAQNGNLHQSVVTRIRMDNPAPPASKATSKIFSLCNPAPPGSKATSKIFRLCSPAPPASKATSKNLQLMAGVL